MVKFKLSDRPEYLTPGEPDSDAARRIMSIMPFLTGRARRWLRRMPERARTGIDVEDLVQELWVKLLEADHRFDPSRGAYITFAAVGADRMLQRLGDRLCRGPRPRPLVVDPGDDRGETPDESTMKAEARQRAQEAVGRAIERLDDRHHFVLTASYGIGREPMSVTQLSAWLARGTSHIIGCRTEAEDQVRAALAG